MKKFIVMLSVALAMVLLALYLDTEDNAINGAGLTAEYPDASGTTGMFLSEEMDGLAQNIRKMQFTLIAVIASMILYSLFMLAGLFLIVRRRNVKASAKSAAYKRKPVPVREEKGFAEYFTESAATKSNVTAIDHSRADRAPTAGFTLREFDTPQQNVYQGVLEYVEDVPADETEDTDTVTEVAAAIEENSLDGRYDAVTGSFFAEALRHITGADISFINSGGIRGMLDSESITENDIAGIFPFGDTAMVLGLTKSQIQAVLEHASGLLPEKDGRFLYVSGITFEPDASMPAGERVASVTLPDGAPLDDDSEYIVAVNDYIANGGDGYEMLAQLPKISDGQTVVQAVLEYASDVGVKDEKLVSLTK